MKEGSIFLKVIRQISRSHGPTNQRSGSDFSVSRWQREFTDGYEMTHTASWSMEEVSYCLSGSSVKFGGDTGRQIGDFYSIWARLLDRSQLSNPSALPCELQTSKFSFISLNYRLLHTAVTMLNNQRPVKWIMAWCQHVNDEGNPFWWWGGIIIGLT